VKSGFSLSVAFIVAELLALFSWWLIPDTLGQGPSELIGAPAFLNYNINKRFFLFYSQAMAVPLLTAALYLWKGGGWPALPRRAETRAWKPSFLPLIKVFLVGTSLGLASVSLPPLLSKSFLLQIVCFGVGYTLLLSLLRPRKQPFAESLAAINVLFVPLILLIPSVVANLTSIYTHSEEIRVALWFPWWLSLGLLGTSYAWLGSRARRGGWPALALAERPLLLVAWLPTLIFLQRSNLITMAKQLDFTHDGEYLVSGDLLLRGKFPWRDFNLTRGLLGECFKAWFGFSVFGNSFWAAKAGESLLLMPLVSVLRYFLCLYVTRGNLWLLLLAVLWLETGALPFFNIQYFPLALQPLVWIAFFELMRRRTLGAAAVFASVAFLSGSVSSEALLTIAASSLVLLVLAWIEKDFRGFLRVHAIYFGWAAVLAIFLWRHDALSPFIQNFLTSTGNRRFVHGYPFDWTDNWPFRIGLFLPLVCHWGVCLSLLLRAKRREFPSPWEWGMLAVSFFIILDFQKFLSTPDGHLWEITGECLPLALWLLGQGLTAGEARLGPRLAAFRPLHIAAVALFLLAGDARYLEAKAQHFTQQFHQKVDRPSSVQKMGPVGENPVLEKMTRDFRRAFAPRLAESDPVYDFTNSKGFFYYLLGWQPLGRYVYTGPDLASQREIIAVLKKIPPKLVVYSGGIFWTQGGIANSVRYWEVSEYLLRHYEPLVRIHDYLILQPKCEGCPSDASLYANVPACDWGYAPFVMSKPSAPVLSVDVKQTRQGDFWIEEIPLPRDREIRFLDITFEKSEPDEFTLGKAASFKTAEKENFTLRLPVSSCPQWWLPQGATIELKHKLSQRITHFEWGK